MMIATGMDGMTIMRHYRDFSTAAEIKTTCQRERERERERERVSQHSPVAHP